MSETLHEGDCLEVMQTLPAESVDMIFADPPFNVGKKYGGKAGSDNRADYYEWCARWIAEGFRLLKPTGTFYLMTIARHVFKMGCEMEKHGVFVNKVEWRNVSACHSKRGFWPSTQPIVVFGKTKEFRFNTYAQRRKITQLRWGGYKTKPQGQLLDYWDDIPFVYAGSVRHPEAILRPGTNKKAHPTQMPVNLAARCILFSTNEGDTVLDPFNGSGTTGTACIKLGRNFIGVERESEYVKLARIRWANFIDANVPPKKTNGLQETPHSPLV
ncbi:MAG: site-specific DNA-methyltransferase [Bacteroidales bacterium]|nr:site-specific DNA-methyltransferase [Bacteroidales bacterium]